MTTIYDIARVTRTSHTTVSRALRDHPLISVRTKQKILHAARKLGYRPSHAAKALKTGKSFSIGILVHSLASRFYSDFFRYLEDACHEDGYSVFVTSSEFNPERETRNLQALLAKGFDAVAIARSRPGDNDDLLAQFGDQGIPVIMLGEVDVPGLPFPAVGFDEPQIGRLAAEHLWSLGHRRVLYVSAARTRDASIRIHQIRSQTFAHAWKTISGQTPRHFPTDDPVLGGNELAEYLEHLPPNDRPTAVACSVDTLALGLISALRNRNLTIPADLSLIGCDDIPGAIEAVVPLTTIRLSTQQMARDTWTLLQQRLANPGQSPPCPPERLIVQPELIVRNSTGALK